jgi:hypothetical protein
VPISANPSQFFSYRRERCRSFSRQQRLRGGLALRDQGYNLRVSPVSNDAEMVVLRSEDPEFLFPSGRYELMLGGQTYDFVVAGEVTDPAHCVEGVATVRGPEFYECKPVL